MKFVMKKILVTLSPFLVLTSLMLALSSPLQADRPFLLFDDTVTFTDLDPCTGLEQEITIYLTGYLHVHKNNFVLLVERSGESDAGYYMFSGVETQTFNTINEVFKASFVDMWRTDDGRLWQVRENFVFDETTFDVRVANFMFRCLKG